MISHKKESGDQFPGWDWWWPHDFRVLGGGISVPLLMLLMATRWLQKLLASYVLIGSIKRWERAIKFLL